MRELVREGAGIVWIAGSENPQVLADVPPARAVRRVVDRPGLAALPPRRRPRRRALRRRGLADARLGRAGLPRARRRRRPLPRSATTCCASRGSAPTIRPTAGAAHAEHLAERAGRLTALDLRELRLRAPGTDLRLALPAGTTWRGGINDVRGHRITPNIPTRGGVHEPGAAGDVRAVPLHAPAGDRGPHDRGHRRRVPARPPRAHRGRRGRRSRIPRLHTSRAIAAPRGWARSRSSTTRSRVGAAGRPYFTTLLDENAAAHIAFGLGLRRHARARRARRSTARWCTSTS